MGKIKLHSDSYITTILGMRGSGKSTLTRLISEDSRFCRKIVFDMVNEWHGTHVANTFEQFANIFQNIFHLDNYTIVIKFGIGTNEQTIVETQTKITELIYRTGVDSQLETCLIFEEAQFYFPNHGLHHVNLHLLTTGRHAFINIIANTQRPASISKLLISQSQVIYVGSLYEINDIKYLSGSIGELAEKARTLPKGEFIYYPVGNPDDISIIEVF